MKQQLHKHTNNALRNKLRDGTDVNKNINTEIQQDLQDVTMSIKGYNVILEL